MAKLSEVKKFIERLLDEEQLREEFVEGKGFGKDGKNIFNRECGTDPLSKAQADQLQRLIDNENLLKKIPDFQALKRDWVAALTAQVYRDKCPQPYMIGATTVSNAGLTDDEKSLRQTTETALTVGLNEVPEVRLIWNPTGPHIHTLASAVNDKLIALQSFKKVIGDWLADPNTSKGDRLIFDALLDRLD